MQSYPIIRLLVMVAALSLAAIGVWNVTHPEVVPIAAASEISSSPSATALRSVVVEFTFSQVPTGFEIATGTGPAITGSPTTPESTVRVDAALPASGADWIIRVHWKNKTVPTAVRVRCRDAKTNQKLADITLWGQGDVEDTVGIK